MFSFSLSEEEPAFSRTISFTLSPPAPSYYHCEFCSLAEAAGLLGNPVRGWRCRSPLPSHNGFSALLSAIIALFHNSKGLNYLRTTFVQKVVASLITQHPLCRIYGTLVTCLSRTTTNCYFNIVIFPIQDTYREQMGIIENKVPNALDMFKVPRAMGWSADCKCGCGSTLPTFLLILSFSKRCLKSVE